MKKRNNMGKRIAYLIAISSVVLLCGCGTKQEGQETNTEVKQKEEYSENLGFQASEYVEICDYQKLDVKPVQIELSETEVDQLAEYAILTFGSLDTESEEGSKSADIPSLDDEFVSEHTSYQTADEFKEAIKKRMEEKQSKQATVVTIMDKIAEESTIVKDFPEEAIEKEIESITEECEQSAEAQGLSVEEYVSQVSGKTLEECAEESLKRSCIQEILINKEQLYVTNEDMDRVIADTIQDTGYTEEMMKANFSEDQLKKQAQYQLVEDYLIECIK